MMVSNLEFINITMTSLKRISENSKVQFKTFKKDRKVEIIKLKEGFTIIEKGFRDMTFENLDYKDVKKHLKDIQKIEFPRSNKLWFKIV